MGGFIYMTTKLAWGESGLPLSTRWNHAHKFAKACNGLADQIESTRSVSGSRPSARENRSHFMPCGGRRLSPKTTSNGHGVAGFR